VDLYIRSPIGLHGVVLNLLSTETTLLFMFFLQYDVKVGAIGPFSGMKLYNPGPTDADALVSVGTGAIGEC
jgi:hypothetical protein